MRVVAQIMKSFELNLLNESVDLVQQPVWMIRSQIKLIRLSSSVLNNLITAVNSSLDWKIISELWRQIQSVVHIKLLYSFRRLGIWQTSHSMVPSIFKERISL